MRRYLPVTLLVLSAALPLMAGAKEKGQFDLYLNGINKGYERYKIEIENKKQLWRLSSEIHFKLPVPKAKRNYIDLMLYPEIDFTLDKKKFDGYYYRMNFNDFSNTDLVEAKDSATEMIDQDMRSYDLFNRNRQRQEDEQADRIDLGVNAGKCIPLGNTLHFEQTRFSAARVKDEPLPADLVVLDAYCFSLYMPLAERALAMKSESEPLTIAFPQGMRLKTGTLEYMGIEKTPWHGSLLNFRHYDLVIDSSINSSFWVDKAGKLVQVAIPSEGLVAVLAKYSPVSYEREEPRVTRQTVVASGTFTEKPVRISSGDITLGATLTLPNGQGPFPTILMVGDLQSLDRDGNDPSNSYSRAGTWKQLAYQLAGGGFASLRWDTRGVGESGGDALRESWGDRENDVVALAKWLQAQPTTKGKGVILLSLGLGGWVAGDAAAKAPVEAAVFISYPAKELLRLWKEQVSNINDPESRLQAYQNLDQLTDHLKETTQEWGSFQGRKIYLAQVREMEKIDPIAIVSALKIPCLFAYPERDTTVMPFHRDVLSPSLHAGQEAVILKGVGHFLTPVDEDNMSSGLVEAKALVPVLTWIKQVSAQPAAP